MAVNREPDRYAAIGPVFQLLRALRQDWLTLDEMADLLDVHRRTIQRILDAVRAADIEIRSRRRADGVSPIEYRVTRII